MQKNDDQIINDKYKIIIDEMKKEFQKEMKQLKENLFTFLTESINKIIDVKAKELQQKNYEQNSLKTEVLKVIKELNINVEENNKKEKNENSKENNDTENNECEKINNKNDFTFENNNIFSEISGIDKKSFMNNFTFQKVFEENEINENDENDENDDITMRYKIKKGERDIQILGTNFCFTYETKCKIIYKNQEYPLTNYFSIEESNNDSIEIKLKGINQIESTNGMFENCSSLISLPDISKWKLRATDMSRMFFGCCSLNELGDISNWNTVMVNDMSEMFYSCSSLKTIPDIYKWNTENVITFKGMFLGCTSLKRLPDISIWDIHNSKNIACLFANCSSLEALPDLSNWNTENVTNFEGMFFGCSCLKTLPDISKWDMTNAKDLTSLFAKCSSLIILPDIYKWNTKNVLY